MLLVLAILLVAGGSPLARAAEGKAWPVLMRSERLHGRDKLHDRLSPERPPVRSGSLLEIAGSAEPEFAPAPGVQSLIAVVP